jgi:transcription elongation factor Elf1
VSQVEEHYYLCPYCGERISSLLDFSLPAQRYIEDCEVCCRPIELEFELEDGRLSYFSAHSLDA